MSKNKTIIPEFFNSNHVKFESLTFNGIQVPIGTTSFKSEYPTIVSLLTCSNKYAYFVAGTTDGFLFGETTRLRQLLRESKIGPALRQLDSVVDKHLPLPVRQLHLSTDELRIIVCMAQGNVMIFDVKDVVDKKNNVTPSGSFKMDDEIIEFKPCPTIFTTSNNKSSSQNKIIMSDITNQNNVNDSNSKGYSELAIILVKNNSNNNNHGHGCFVINWHTGFITANISCDSATAIAWSPKGDEVVCGFTNGSIKCYTVFGLQTYEINAPLSKYQQQQQEKENDDKEGKKSLSHHVQEIVWINQNTFFVIYTNEYGNNAYIIQRPLSPEQSVKYKLLDNITPLGKSHLSSLDYIQRSNLFSNPKFYTHVIHGFGPSIKYAIIIASTTSSHLMVVGHYQQQQDINNKEKDIECWATWTCPSFENHFQHSNNNYSRTKKNSRTLISLYTNHNTFTTTASTEPIYPVGVTIDYTATPTLFGKSFDSATPILYYITNEGMINGYIINRGDKPFFSMYDGMIRVLSSLKNIPSPTKAATVMEQQQHLQSLNTQQQAIESEHPFIDAVKYYEQEKVSLWKQPRHIPTFRSLGVRSNVRIPHSSYIITKPTFGKTSMSGFRFGTTPRFGDRDPTRLGVPISDEPRMTPIIMDNNNDNDHNDVKPELINNNTTRKEFLFQDFFQQEESSSMNSLKANNGSSSSSSSRFSFISSHPIHPTDDNNNQKEKEQEFNFLINSVADKTFACDSNNTKLEKMEDKKSIMNKKSNNSSSTCNGVTTTTSDSQQEPIKNEPSYIVENNTDNKTETLIPSDKNEKIKNEQSQVTNDNNNNNTTLSENEQKMKRTKEDEDDIISNLDIQQHNEPMKSNINNEEFHDRALELLKEAGQTYYSLLKAIEARLPLGEQQQQQQVPSSSSSSNSVKSSGKENNYPVKSSQPQQQEERYINIKDIPGWLLTLSDSINNLKEDVLEKEQELRQLRYNLSQMEGIYVKAMSETKVKTVLVQQEENDNEKKSQLLYEQVANHLNHEVFLDTVMNNTIEQQQRQRQQ